jgi:hypothetical protein
MTLAQQTSVSNGSRVSAVSEFGCMLDLNRLSSGEPPNLLINYKVLRFLQPT